MSKILLAQAGIGQAGRELGKTADAAGVKDNADISVLIGSVISTALTLVGLIFLILMVYAGYLWMTARGEEDQIDKARKIIIAAVIGLVIVVSAYAITVLVTTQFK